MGATHWDKLGGSDVPGAQPVLFFAPAQAAKRATDWGPTVLQDRIAAAWQEFMRPVTRAEQPWLQVVRGRGTAAVEACYTTLLDGTAQPQEGHILSV